MSARRLAATLRLDVRLQARNQLYGIGIAVAVVTGLVIRFLLPEAWVGRGLAAFLLVGLGGTTSLFGASMLLLEKGEHTLEALRTSMITAQDYVIAKTLTLTGFALIESLIVWTICARGTPTNVPLLLVGTAVLGIFYTLVGVGLAAGFDAITRFLLPTGAVVGLVLQLPFLSLLGIEPWWLWYAIPTQAPLLLIQGAFEPLTAEQWAYAVGMSFVMLPAGWRFCLSRFRAHIQLPE